jgi:large subunit ribosomal protein L19
MNATNTESAAPAKSGRDVLEALGREQLKNDVPEFRPGDTVKVYVRIVEGGKERVQIFQGVVIKRHRNNQPNATFTVRKVSYKRGSGTDVHAAQSSCG